jgi:hypothetical protein
MHIGHGITATYILGMMLVLSGGLVIGFKNHWELFPPAPAEANVGMALAVAGTVLVGIALLMAEYVLWRWDRR